MTNQAGTVPAETGRNRIRMSRNRGRAISPDLDTDSAGVRLGRRAPYTQLGDWVMLAPKSIVRPPAKLLYWALSSHLSARQQESEAGLTVSPTLDMLAHMLGYSDGRKLLTYIDDLVTLGAIEVETDLVIGEGNRRRNTYVIHQSPPPDYGHFESLGEFYRAYRQAKEAERSAKREARNAAVAQAPAPIAVCPDGDTEPVCRDGYAEPDCPNGYADIEPDEGTRRGNENGGRNAAPRPPAYLTAGRVSSLVSSGGDQQGDPLTAHASARADENDTPAKSAVRRSPTTTRTSPRRAPVRRSTRRTAPGIEAPR